MTVKPSFSFSSTLQLRSLLRASLLATALCTMLPCLPAYAAASKQASLQAFNRQAWLDDYASFKKQLEQHYANLSWFASPGSGVNLPRLDQHIRKVLLLTDNDRDAAAALNSFVSALHDDHFRQLSRIEPGVGEVPEPAPADIAHLDAAAACVAIGVGTTGGVPFSLPVETLGNFSLLSDGTSQAFRSGIVHAASGTRIGFVRIPFFVLTEYPALCAEAWNGLKTKGETITSSSLMTAMDGAWWSNLAERLKRLKEAGANAVVVDVGNNGGGGDLGDVTARLFSSAPVHSARMWMVADADGEGYFARKAAALQKGLEAAPDASPAMRSAATQAASTYTQRGTELAGRACDLSWVWKKQGTWNPAGCSRLIDVGFSTGALDYLPPSSKPDSALATILYRSARADAYRGAWSGPVFVLANTETYSAAEMFVAVMRDNGVAKLVGTRTGGAGCGQIHTSDPIVLPHSQLRYKVPNCVRLRRDGSDEVKGITPDLPVLPRNDESSRARAQRMLDVIEADFNKPHQN